MRGVTRNATSAVRAAIALTASLLAFTAQNVTAAPPETGMRVDPQLNQSLPPDAGGSAEFIVILRAQADLTPAQGLLTKREKGRFVCGALRRAAEETQAPVLRDLRDSGAATRSLWIVNAVMVSGGRPALDAVTCRDDVREVWANRVVRMPLPRPDEVSPTALLGIEWNVARVRAPEVWALGFAGQGVVVGGQDTGYDWDHPALMTRYRGWNGSTADHNHNWHDAIHSGSSPPASATSEAFDPYGHGTHTMGTMVGSNGADRVGVAPEARWIGCRNMDNSGNGTFARYLECFQWFLAPTDLAGGGADPDLAPDVINNSWGFTAGEGCTNPSMLQAAVEACRAAGIVVVASAGNLGSSASSCHDPPAIYDATFTVGSTDSSDIIAASSSRGPVTVDGSGRTKPDISAPGVNVRSCYPGTGYGNSSGTSMAAPHVAGIVALVLSAHPGMKGHVDRIEMLLTRSAVPRSSPVPDNNYGWGRVDALEAVGLDDTDADAMPNWWEYAFGLNPTNNADGAGDADDDGQSNADEWAVNTDPTDDAALLEISALTLGTQHIATVTWNSRQNGLAQARLYDLLRCTNGNPAPGNWHTVASNIPPAGDTTTATNRFDPEAGQAWFYRVAVRQASGQAALSAWSAPVGVATLSTRHPTLSTRNRQPLERRHGS